MLQRLIEEGADVNSQDFSGQTAFAWAAGSDATGCGESAAVRLCACLLCGSVLMSLSRHERATCSILACYSHTLPY